ncbi:MAG TPA: SRPBCC family protein [Steroidobacteraceae bacterium]|nr:SRPBCC family protein [Steroidobacteraceae bacterium]HVC02673.1 SRPBCC family protein [Steroidobacteraceae bacterium]
MKKITAMACALCLSTSATSFAAAHWLRVTQSVRIDASAGRVWDAAKKFDALDTWHPAVAADRIVAGTNDRPGAVRLLTLKGGGTIKEQLLSFDARGRRFRYKILEGVLPVSDYTSTFTVKSIGRNKSEATWAGRFKRKDRRAHPAPNDDDKAALRAVKGVYRSGLDNLKKIVEAKSRG